MQEQSVREKKQKFCSLFHVFCSIAYAISCVFLCLPLSSFFCVEKDLLFSSERCFVYYLKIQATELFEISQKSVHMNIVTNILPLFITIFIFHCYDLPVIFIPNSTQISGFFSKKILLSVTAYWTTFIPNTLLVLNFCHSEDHVCFYMSGNRNGKLVRNVSFPKIFSRISICIFS
jgi:hypothetical protein